jgi:glyoxylase-like metal-dependent hydrolase (beta-lactamase superfamily II)
MGQGSEEVRVQLSLRVAGSCEQLEHMVMNNRSRRAVRFPALFGVMRHPREGVILFDTGYSRHFMEQTRAMPARLYAELLPVTLRPEDEAAAQLEAMGIGRDEVSTVFVSHFHGDHVSALADFPKARFVYAREAWEAVKPLSGVAGLLKAYLPGMIPPDFEARGRGFGPEDMTPLGPGEAPFTRGFDVFGDGSLVAVELPGHAKGQVGLLVKAQEGQDVFLCADAAWTTAQYKARRMPFVLATGIFDDRAAYAASLAAVALYAELHPKVWVIPSHCEEAQARWWSWMEPGLARGA